MASVNAIQGLVPEPVWRYFAEISNIPRPSHHEERIGEYLMRFSSNSRMKVEQDEVGNVVMRLPASQSLRDRDEIPSDMVCEWNHDENPTFNPLEDPILLERSDCGEWIHAAKGTTLGADNGIGMALALALLEELTQDESESSFVHPAIEALFTVNEEAGFTGARGIVPGQILSKWLINVDSCTFGRFCVGSAGAGRTLCEAEIGWHVWNAGCNLVKIEFKGLTGGHSGKDIRWGRANSLKLCGAILDLLEHMFEEAKIGLVSVVGGNKFNALPRECELVLVLDSEPDLREKVEGLLKSFEEICRERFDETDPKMAFAMTDLPRSDEEVRVFDMASVRLTTKALEGLPHGVKRREIDEGHSSGYRLTSSVNLANVRISEGKLVFGLLARGALLEHLHETRTEIEELGKVLGFDVVHSTPSAGWDPMFGTGLLRVCTSTFEQLFAEVEELAKPPRVFAAHAGLEVGEIFQKMRPGSECVSFGATIVGNHSPGEKLKIGSVKMAYDFLRKVVLQLGQL